MNELKHRKFVSQVLKFIDDKEILAIYGSRQVGKTSLLHYLINNHIKKKVPLHNIFYFDLEDFALLDLCNDGPDEVIKYLKSRGGDTNIKIFFLIDEIQYLKNLSSFLKLFYDRYKNNIKLIVSVSSSFLINKKFRDSLVTYIKRDIRDIVSIKDINKFNNLLQILASTSTNLLNITELSNTIGIAKQTVEKYIFMLESTYIIRKVYPFHRNIRSELTKMPKLFFEDTGMLNILVNKTFSNTITGQLFENSIYSLLSKN